MKLVVAEKPSVAQSLAAVLGAKEKKDGYLEGGGWLVSWCVGHLVELAQPEAYGEQYAKWRYADLPILPAHWKYDVARDKKKQLGVLRRLMEDKRVDAVVCAIPPCSGTRARPAGKLSGPVPGAAALSMRGRKASSVKMKAAPLRYGKKTGSFPVKRKPSQKLLPRRS